MHPDYKRAWLHIPAKHHTYMSCLNVDVDLRRLLMQHMYDGSLRHGGLLDGPLVSFCPRLARLPLPTCSPLFSVLAINKRLNPVCSIYKTMLDVGNGNNNGIPVLQPSAVRPKRINQRVLIDGMIHVYLPTIN
jgi:hypothetical protein